MQPCRRKRQFLISSLFLLFCCLFTLLPNTPAWRSAALARTASPPAEENVPVLTYKYNNQRTGQNSSEQILNTKNVNAQQFGRLISYPVDGQVYAQPLYMPGMRIGGHLYNLVIVATEHDSVYAFDADRTDGNPTPIWHTSLLRAGMRPVPASAFHCNDLKPQLGITSTPVIDSASATLFVVAFVAKQGRYIYELHALNLLNGHDRHGSPVQIDLGFLDNGKERQRSGLLLANGRIYFAFSSFCDIQPYHGGILSYSYDRRGFHRLAAYNDTPRGSEGGIWSSGSALAADQKGNIYAISGNGTFDLNRGGPDAGDSFLKFDKDLRLLDYFTPFNQSCLSSADLDLGSGGPLLISDNELIGGGKEGRLYVLNTAHMGHFREIANACSNQQATSIDQVLQETAPHTVRPIFSTPAYWEGPDGQYLFVSSIKDHTRVFKISNGHLSGVLAQTPEAFAYSGGDPVVSCNGRTPGSAILWLITAPGYLRAYDAANLSHELYSDRTGSYNKFTAPVVTNGKVFVATQNSLKIYGLLAQSNTTPSLPPETPSGH